MAYPNLPPAPPPPENIGSTNVAFDTSLRMDLSYLTSPIGILRILIAVLNAIGAICIGSSSFSTNGRGIFFLVVSLCGLWYTLMIITAYTFHAVEKFNNWRWLQIELGVAVALVLLNMITSTIAVAFGLPSYSAAGFFGYLCMVAYGAEAWVCARAGRGGAPAQGRVLPAKAPAPARQWSPSDGGAHNTT